MVDNPVLILIGSHNIADPLIGCVGSAEMRDLAIRLQPLVELVMMVRRDSSKVTCLISTARLL